MTFSATCDATLLRSLLLTLAAWPVCHVLERGLRASSRSSFYGMLLVSPFLFPELLLGYLVAPWVQGRPIPAEIACDAILLLRAIPIGVIALWCSPPSEISAAALHVRRLKWQTPRDAIDLALCYWHGPIRRGWPACGLMFLVAFQEFEAAALLYTASWTDWILTEQARGLTFGDSLPYLIRPVGIQIAALGAICLSLLGRTSNGPHEVAAEVDPPVSDANRRGAEFTAAAFCVIGVIIPLGCLSRELIGGWKWLVAQSSAVTDLMTRMTTAGLIGLVSGLAAWIVARHLGFVFGSASWRRSPRIPVASSISATGLLPGLCGGLTVCLVIKTLCSQTMFQSLSRTPVAWVLALLIWLLPRAWLFQWWLTQRTEPTAGHLVQLLRDSPDARQSRTAHGWQWRWDVEPRIVAVGILCYWAYLDVTSASLLAPPGMVSMVVLLYNLMHYGHSAALSMQAALVMFVPVVLWGLMMAIARAVVCHDGLSPRVAKSDRR